MWEELGSRFVNLRARNLQYQYMQQEPLCNINQKEESDGQSSESEVPWMKWSHKVQLQTKDTGTFYQRIGPSAHERKNEKLAS